MPKQSAGILLYKIRHKFLEVFLVHPGGPFWANKDAGAWSIPKGEFSDNEDGSAAAMREFKEETGQSVEGNFTELSPVRLKSGKKVYCWAVEGDADAQTVQSIVFDMEWPPRSGKQITIPEVDRAEWFKLKTAKEKINQAQVSFLEQLETFITC